MTILPSDRLMKNRLSFLILLLAVTSIPAGRLHAEKSDRKTLGAVATQHPLATDSAARVLRDGGNAVDAAIAAALTLAVVEPYHSGLGGGGMALVWTGDPKKTYAVDFRETAPRAATAGMFAENGFFPNASEEGPFAIGIPGQVSGLFLIHQRWGKLPWAKLFDEAIQYSEQGFEADAELLKRVKGRRECLMRDYHSSRNFQAILQGEVPPIWWVQSDLAASLKKIASGGAREFYQGDLAQQLIIGLKSKGALLNLADLRGYRPLLRAPLFKDYSWGRVWGMPLPSSGGIGVISALNILEELSGDQPERLNREWAPWTVLTLQATFQERNALMGDPDFVPNLPVKKWLSKDEAARVAKSILAEDGKSPVATKDKPMATEPSGETSHLSVIDASGNAVSMTLTLNLAFGGCVTAGDTGIIMNDQMDDFTTELGKPNAFGLVQSPANGIAPGKRPLSSMSPTLVTQLDQVRLAIGAPGGPKIISSVLEAMARIFILKQDTADAIAAPRIHYQGAPRPILLEPPGLRLYGAQLESLKLPFEESQPWSNVQAVSRFKSDKGLEAFSDPRGIGKALVVESN